MSDDFQALRARALKAREFTAAGVLVFQDKRGDKTVERRFDLGEHAFTLRTPTQHEVTQVLHRHRLLADGYDVTVERLLRYHLLCGHVIGWTGVRQRDLLPASARDDSDAALAAPLPWSPDAVPLYLDANQAVASALADELMRRTAARDAALEADAGN